MNGMDGLKAFCDELASDEPSPGGGTAAAAAGAMSASLLSMVCGITLKSRKHEKDWPRLAALKAQTDELAALLLKAAGADATSYQEVVRAARARRGSPDDQRAVDAYDDAMKKAIEVPASTAEMCVRALELAREVASVGIKSASSDIEVAELLAAAGVEGALANIMINLPYCADKSYSARAGERAAELRRRKDGHPAP